MRRLHRLPLLLILVAGCGTSAPATPAPSPAVATAPASVDAAPAAPPEASVRPGANTEYLKADLEVRPWIERFERGGREIYDKRTAILRATGVRPGMNVADVGAGTGLFTMLFADAVGGDGRVYAVDIVPKFLAHIDDRARKKGLANITTVLGSERSISLPESSVDLIFLCDAYHHFEYPRSMNASLWKALRPGGRLVLIDFERVPGRSAQWILDHVRAGKEVFSAELAAAGFEEEGEVPLLEENYILRFRKPARGD